MDSVQRNATMMNQQLSQNIKPVLLTVWSTRLFLSSKCTFGRKKIVLVIYKQDLFVTIILWEGVHRNNKNLFKGTMVPERSRNNALENQNHIPYFTFRIR